MRKRRSVTGGALVLAAALVGSALAQERQTGLIAGSFYASCPDSSCSSLVVTGQFLAPAAGYAVSVAEAAEQTTPTLLRLDVTATEPAEPGAQVLTIVPVQYVDADGGNSPYGVEIVYGKQRVIVGIGVASVSEAVGSVP